MGHMVVRNVARCDAAVLDQLRAGGTATVHEAMGKAGLLSHEIGPIQAEATVAGSAVTVLTDPTDNLMIHAAVEVCRPGDVLLVATTGLSTHGMIGELMVTSLRTRGVVGIVTDAGIRDTAAIRRMGFPVWARAISAQGTTKKSPGSVNVPVVCGGQEVHPGDGIVADDDGVVCVPRARSAQVAEAVLARLASEMEKRSQFEAGALGLDIHGLRQVLAELGVEYDESETP